MIEVQIDFLKKIGFSDDEINLYGIDFLLQYFRFHRRKDQQITVFFSGFKNEEFKLVKDIAIKNDLTVEFKFSEKINILCVKESFNGDLRKLQEQDFFIVLLEEVFLEIFKEREIIINRNENIYLYSIYEEFRIIKPLSNFNCIHKVDSYSDETSKFYNVNLYFGTCSCKDYSLSNRGNFQSGDLRRYCKHLKDLYRISFPQNGNEGIKKYFFDNRFNLKKNLRKISLPIVDKPLYLSYNLDDGGCEIYFPTKNNSFEIYHYDYEAEYFSYDDKPYGYVKDLRIELNKIFRKEKESFKKRQMHREMKESDANVKGCIYFFCFIVIIICFIFF